MNNSTVAAVDGPQIQAKRIQLKVGKCIAEVSQPKVIQAQHLHKVRHGGRVYYRRFRVRDDIRLQQVDTDRFFRSRGRSVLIDEIVEVRSGMKTEIFEKNKGKGKLTDIEENRCFSLVIGHNRETLDLVARSQEYRDTWVKALNGLIAKKKNSSIKDYQDTWVREFFMKADRNKDGSLTLKEIEKILPEMNIDIKKSHIRSLFDSANTDKSSNRKGEQALDSEEFVAFCRALQARPEVDALFESHSLDGEYMTAADLKKFLKEEQRVNVTDEYINEMMTKHEPSKKARENGYLSKEGFRFFLLDEEQQIMIPEHKEIFHDMTKSITQYFIASSHNTYLMADQLRGPSSTEAYIRALERGCRCVELDCWDGPDKDPVVYHGHTLTSKILFKDAIRAINEYAFKTTEYPLILSLENHCSVEQQEVMVKHMKDILKDKLDYPDETRSTMPSPEKFKGKILIKGKSMSRKFDTDTRNDEDDVVSEDDEAAEIEADVVMEQKAAEDREMRKGLKLDPELGYLARYLASTGFKGFEYAAEHCQPYQISSLAEKKFKKLHDDAGAKFADHCKMFPVRTYPDGFRTDSSNYNPCQAWACGAQIVALNYQYPGRELQLNMGKFSINGLTGYLLKPSFLRNMEEPFDPRGPFPKDWEKLLTLTVISGYQLPKLDKRSDVVDPFVRISIHGVEADKQEMQTKVINNNGFNPVWNETFQFKIKVPELALVRFAVKDDNRVRSDANLANFTIPFNSIQQGHRHIPLFDESGNLFKYSFLITHVDIEESGKNRTQGGDAMAKIHNSRLYKRLNTVVASRTDGGMTKEETDVAKFQIQGNPKEVLLVESYETTV